MAITANEFNIQKLPSEGSEFHLSLATEDATGAETILAGVANKSHFLTGLTIRSDAAMDITIGSDVSASAVVTTHIGPVPVSAEAGIFPWKAPAGKGLRFTSGKAITIDASASGTIWIEAHGKTCKDNMKL